MNGLVARLVAAETHAMIIHHHLMKLLLWESPPLVAGLVAETMLQSSLNETAALRVTSMGQSPQICTVRQCGTSTYDFFSNMFY